MRPRSRWADALWTILRMVGLAEAKPVITYTSCECGGTRVRLPFEGPDAVCDTCHAERELR